MWLISLAWECCSATAQFSGVFKCHNYFAYSLLGSVPFKSASAISLVSNLLRRGVEQESHLVFSLSKIKVMLWVEGSNYGNCARNVCIVLSIFSLPPLFLTVLQLLETYLLISGPADPVNNTPPLGGEEQIARFPSETVLTKIKQGFASAMLCYSLFYYFLYFKATLGFLPPWDHPGILAQESDFCK